ncbi:MAG: CotH kinase family protein, partial [Bacteroidia bacterium]
MKSKYLLLLLFVVASFSGFSQFKFNEYSCANISTVINPIGAGTQTSPDWIEICNTSTTRFVQISGWYISDDRNNLYKWQVPYYNNVPIIIDSFAMQVVFLDGYNVTRPGSIPTASPQAVDLHANFTLNQTQPSVEHGQLKSGPYIWLTKKAACPTCPQPTTPTDSIIVQRNQPGHSWGRPNSVKGVTYSGGSTVWRLYKTPTPGTKNPINPIPITTTRNWYAGYAPTPKLSLKPGYYSGAPNLSIVDTTNVSSNNPNLSYFGTVDCSIPNISSTDIDNTTGQVTFSGSGSSSGAFIVRGVIIDQSTPPTYLPSFEAYGAYVIDSTYHMSVFCACMDTNSLFIARTKDTVPTLYSYIDKTTKKEIFKNQGQALIKKIDFYNNIGTPGQAWQFQFRSEDEYGYNYTNKYAFYQDANLGAITRADFPELILRSSAEDNFFPSGNTGGSGGTFGSFPGYGNGPNHVRDFFNHTITLRHKLNFESSHYTPTYLFINGMNKGIYYIKEPIDTTYMKYYYGYNQSNIIANDLVPTTTTARITALSGNLAAWNAEYNQIMLPGYSVHIPNNYQAIADSIDLASFIDYNFYNMFSVNTDYTKRQALWWKGSDTIMHGKKWRFGLTNTDLTWGFGNNNTGISDFSPTSSPCDYINAFGPGANNQFPLVPLFGKLMTNDTFKSGFLSRYQDLLNTSYACDSLVEHLKYVRTLIKGDMASQVNLYLNNSGGGCTSCDSVKLWNSMLDSMNTFMTQRCSLAVQGIKNCYGYDGPYNLCVDVVPPGAGYVKFNSLTLHSFV